MTRRYFYERIGTNTIHTIALPTRTPTGTNFRKDTYFALTSGHRVSVRDRVKYIYIYIYIYITHAFLVACKHCLGRHKSWNINYNFSVSLTEKCWTGPLKAQFSIFSDLKFSDICTAICFLLGLTIISSYCWLRILLPKCLF